MTSLWVSGGWDLNVGEGGSVGLTCQVMDSERHRTETQSMEMGEAEAGSVLEEVQAWGKRGSASWAGWSRDMGEVVDHPSWGDL